MSCLSDKSVKDALFYSTNSIATLSSVPVDEASGKVFLSKVFWVDEASIAGFVELTSLRTLIYVLG